MQSTFIRKAFCALLTPLALAGAIALASPAQAAPVIGAAATAAAPSAVQSVDWHGYHRHCSWHHHHRFCR